MLRTHSLSFNCGNFVARYTSSGRNFPRKVYADKKQKQNKQYQNINQKHPKTKDMFRKQTQTSEKQSTRCIAENSVARLKMHVAEQIRQMWQKYVATR
jgi:hypothetical protein